MKSAFICLVAMYIAQTPAFCFPCQETNHSILMREYRHFESAALAGAQSFVNSFSGTPNRLGKSVILLPGKSGEPSYTLRVHVDSSEMGFEQFSNAVARSLEQLVVAQVVPVQIPAALLKKMAAFKNLDDGIDALIAKGSDGVGLLSVFVEGRTGEKYFADLSGNPNLDLKELSEAEKLTLWGKAPLSIREQIADLSFFTTILGVGDLIPSNYLITDQGLVVGIDLGMYSTVFTRRFTEVPWNFQFGPLSGQLVNQPTLWRELRENLSSGLRGKIAGTVDDKVDPLLAVIRHAAFLSGFSPSNEEIMGMQQRAENLLKGKAGP